MTSEKFHKDIIKLIGSFGNATILELNCGNGSNIKNYIDNNGNYFAFEPDVELYMEARKRIEKQSNIFLNCGNVFRIPQNKYDFVLIDEEKPELARQAVSVILKKNLTSELFMIVFKNYSKIYPFIDSFFQDIMIPVGEPQEAVAIGILPDKKQEIEERLIRESI